MDIRKKFAKYVSQNIFGMLGISCYVVADTFLYLNSQGQTELQFLILYFLYLMLYLLLAQ